MSPLLSSRLKAKLFGAAWLLISGMLAWWLEHCVTSAEAHEQAQDTKIFSNEKHIEANQIRQDDDSKKIDHIQDRVDRIYDILVEGHK